MHVLFVDPCFPRNQPEFVRALAETGTKVTGIGGAPADQLPGAVRSWLADYEQVGNVCDVGALQAAVRKIQGKGWVDRLEATIEAHIMPVAHVREACGIPGTSVWTAHHCRDKPAMKEVLREVGVPCAQSDGVSTPEEAREFARKVGYPLIFKPRSGAGAADTERVDNDRELEAAIVSQGIDQGHSSAAEEFVEGHEAFYDTLCVGGQVLHEFITHYYPVVLHAMRTRWISPYFITTNRLEAPPYQQVRSMGRQVIEALQIGTSATHMEWFYGPRGLKFSEIGCRPPGVATWDIYAAANDFDIYKEWARAVTGQPSAEAPSGRFSAGMIALRPDRDGRVIGYEGVDRIENAYGEWIIDAHFPPPGHPTQPVEAGYMANAWIRMRHPDYDELRRMMEEIGQTIQMRAE
jgi:formate-dependent phosphoribosylglycinamide formyltransferase (GAR transformylase)